MQQESIQYDVVIIGAGPAGLSCAIHLKQSKLSVAILEKGHSIGAHILSGAIVEPLDIDELASGWQAKVCNAKICKESLQFFTSKHAMPLMVPANMSNHGNLVLSLGELCQHLATEAEALGVDIFTGYSASDPILLDGKVVGVKTKEFGVDANGNKMDNYQPSINFHAKHTVIAEGCRGSIAETIIARFGLRPTAQTYGLGIKELWKIDGKLHEPGKVLHCIGWPLYNQAYGGGFVYHQPNQLISIGLITALDYRNPYLDPFQEMQKLKHHPSIKKLLVNGKRVSFGAKTIAEGGWQAIPKLTFPGGLIVGDSAGFVNIAKIKGTNNAIQSGKLAAKAIIKDYDKSETSYNLSIRQSSIAKDLRQVRNIRPGFKYGIWLGLINSAFELFITKGKSPWTLSHKLDRQTLLPAAKQKVIQYPAADNTLTFDKSSSIYLSGTMHPDNQVSHLQLQDTKTYMQTSYTKYAAPETRYCPAGVYEINQETTALKINYQNCLHCKACDIKDPSQSITWTVPEGGSGPTYLKM